MTFCSEMATDGICLFIPDTLRNWPWPRQINPNYSTCKAESSTWCESFRAFGPRAQKAFNKCDFNLLASLAYPLLDAAGCRIGCDLMNLFFVIDEHSDVVDEKEARAQVAVIMDAIRHPYKSRPWNEWVGGEIARQFWANAIRVATPSSQRRFIATFEEYLDAVVEQALDRSTDHVRTVESYFTVRRDTVGAKPSFAICELYMNIPDDVIRHPVISKLSELCTDMLIIGNDLCSYNVEQARGDDSHNLVTVVMRQFQMDVHNAIRWISELHDDLARQFIDQWKKIPTFGGPIDRELRTYCDGLGNWVRANDCWSFESERYFGKHGITVQVRRSVRKLNKSKVDPDDEDYQNTTAETSTGAFSEVLNHFKTISQSIGLLVVGVSALCWYYVVV